MGGRERSGVQLSRLITVFVFEDVSPLVGEGGAGPMVCEVLIEVLVDCAGLGCCGGPVVGTGGGVSNRRVKEGAKVLVEALGKLAGAEGVPLLTGCVAEAWIPYCRTAITYLTQSAGHFCIKVECRLVKLGSLRKIRDSPSMVSFRTPLLVVT